MSTGEFASRAAVLPDDVRQALARTAGRLGALSRMPIWYAEIGSTNDAALEAASRGAAEGTIIAADMQTAGRGRLGRTWASPPGAGIYTSIVLRPAPHVTPLLTLAVGVALAEGILAATGLAADLKWPNDVYIGGRKLAGILAEGASTPGGIQQVIVGFGINVMPAAYPPDVAVRATSLETEVGRAVDRGMVLAECLAAIAARYDDLRHGRGDAVVDRWRRSATAMLRRPIEWDTPAGPQRGTAEGIDNSGALLVRSNDGNSMRLISGEVRWI